MPAVIAENLLKKYGKGKTEVIAVNELSFQVKEASLFGVIGPDGAGKTSLFRMLTSLLLPDGGKALVAGNDIVKDYRALRNIIGYMPGRFSLYQDLTVEENLQFFATIFNTSIKENYDLIRDIYIQIEPFKDRRAGKLSGGMKQKLALCCALIHRPVILFLDEPTTGVDAVSRVEFWDMLKRLKSQGITILVSTPYMDEASLCDTIALMQGGKFLTTGTPEEIVRNYGQEIWAVKADDMYTLIQDLNADPEVQEAYAFGEYAHAVHTGSASENDLRQYLSAKGHKNIEVQTATPNIEDCFLKLMR
jgi:ABC-type multidrug transport system ATPase subunit